MRPIVGIRGRAAVAEQDQLAVAGKALVNRSGSGADLFRLFARYLRPQLCVILHFHLDGCRDLRQQIVGVLFFLAKKGIKESRFADVVTQFAMFEKNVNGFPERVIKNLNHLLMHERIVSRGGRRNSPAPGKREGHAHCVRAANFRAARNLGIALRRSEAHHDIFGLQKCFQPRTEEQGKIERGQRALSDDYGMHKFDRDMLRIGGVGAAAKGQQAAALEKALGHVAAGFRQPDGLAREEIFDDPFRAQQELLQFATSRARSHASSCIVLLANAWEADRRPACP